ncbi:MAG: LemA family protein [Thermodesulfobacteriota bacterium]
MLSGLMIILLVVLLFAALGGVGYVVSLFNSLVQVKNNIGKAWHNIDVLLLQRNEEIPQLIDLARAYGKYEAGLLEEITRLRLSYAKVKHTGEKTTIENELSAQLRQLRQTAEQYPDIKADILYRSVQERVSALEEMIADRRIFFNDTVTIYNIQREQFPQRIFARLLGFERHPLLDMPGDKRTG